MSVNDKTIRNPHLAACYENFQRIEKLYHELVDDLTDEQLTWKPSEQRWSVAQNIGHLLETNRLYYERLQPMVKAAVDAGKADPPSTAAHKSGFFGGMLLKATDPNGKRKVKTFKPFQPKPMSNTDQRREFLNYHHKMAQLCVAADGLNTRKNKIASPLSSLMRINLGDALNISTVHAERHFNQARRLFDELGFPSAK